MMLPAVGSDPGWIMFSLQTNRTRDCLDPDRDHLFNKVSVQLFWSATECDWCVHTFPNELHQGAKRSRVRFNRTKQGRCENTLSWFRLGFCRRGFTVEDVEHTHTHTHTHKHTHTHTHTPAAFLLLLLLSIVFQRVGGGGAYHAHRYISSAQVFTSCTPLKNNS